MNSNFAFITHNSTNFLVYTPWWNEGIVHGMTLRELSFGGEASSEAAAALCRAIGSTQLAHPHQTHGDLFFDGRSAQAWSPYIANGRSLTRFGEYDAMIVSSTQPLAEERLAYGVATADCVPVVLRGEGEWALIHAGWRGLANGIISKVARAMNRVNQAVIFPCAGGTVYEVGGEVIDAIGASAVYTPLEGGKVLLDTAETAKTQLLSFVTPAGIESSGICTISDERFHSYRRCRELAGRSVTFISPRGPA